MNTTVLECHSLSKRFGDLLAVDSLTLQVYEGVSKFKNFEILEAKISHSST